MVHLVFTLLQLAESAKAQFSARCYSDHLAVVRAYDGWRDAEKRQSGYEYCWRNFLSAQTLKAIDSLKKQFFYLLKDAGLIDQGTENSNKWSHDDHLVRAIICAGLFPGVASVVVSQVIYAFILQVQRNICLSASLPLLVYINAYAYV